METETLYSLSELAKKLGLNKSKLSYYVSLGLLTPDNTVGKMMIFNKVRTLSRVKEIEKLRKKGLSLQEVKAKLDK